MLFLLDFEPDFDFVTQDSLIVKQLLDYNAHDHNYYILSLNDFYRKDSEELKKAEDFPSEYQNAIPVGSVQFVKAFLNIFWDIDSERSIEIPLKLQKSEFLKRSYGICLGSELPKKGNFFIKDATEQRTFSFCGDIKNLHAVESCPIVSAHEYVVAEEVEILSEYRIYIINKEIKNIVCYKGDPTIFPDMQLINKIIDTFVFEYNVLPSFSFDIMITPRGSAIIEVHTYMSLGLFLTHWDESLLMGYLHSMNYIKNNNGSINYK